MATRTRQGSGTRGKPVGDKAVPRTPSARDQVARKHAIQKSATTPDATRQQQALDNQGPQGRMAPSWRTRISDDDEDEDETPPTLH